MAHLGFRIVRSPYPSSSRLTGIVVQKIRDEGRVGPVVGDEAALWDALVESEQEAAQLLEEVKDLRLRVATQNEGITPHAEKAASEKGRGKR